MNNGTNLNHHDMLIEAVTILRELKADFDNHLQHHFKATMLAWTVALGAVVTLAIALIKIL